MKLTLEKLTQIIREEVKEARKRPEWARGGANYDPERARERYRERGDVDNFGPIKRRKRPSVPESTFKEIIDAVSKLPGSPGAPEIKSDEQGAGFVALRNFFLENEDFYKELIRQADLAWMESGPEDKITDALHADNGLFSKVDPQMVLAILNAVNPAKFAHLKGKKE